MPEIRRIRPTPTDAELNNPHKGCCTFQHFTGQPLFAGTRWSEDGPTTFPTLPAGGKAEVVDGYLPSPVAYCRWYWRMMESERGKYDFSMIDGALEAADAHGQTLAVRLMPFGSAGATPAPDWYAKQYPMEINRRKRTPFPAPVHDAPSYLEHYGGLIREFARRYDGHALLETVDVAFVGPWGEGAGDISAQTIRQFARLYAAAFAQTPRLALIGGDQMRESAALGAGWRCDCFGDLGGFPGPFPKNLQWAHMYDFYAQAVVSCGAADAWKTAPVHFETCWVPTCWYRNGWDLDFILQQGLKYHGTYFMPKYCALPPAWMKELAEFCRKLGYRFVLRNVTLDAQVPVGGAFQFQCWIENVGVAPIYRRYDVALRLRQGSREDIVSLDRVDIRHWLPGDAYLDERIQLPAGFAPGSVDVSVGLVDPATRQPKVAFAIEEQYADRWAPLGAIQVSEGPAGSNEPRGLASPP